MTEKTMGPRFAANRICNMAARHQSESTQGQAKFLASVAKLVEAQAKRLQLAELEQQGANRE
ncbi:MAG: hypothetical protein NXH85_18600 [Pseudomonadaceae bacterium]|nr:hypothetical protein [Pseudomonadaceae bacterium]